MKSEYIDMFDNYFSGSFNEQEEADFDGLLKTDIKMAEALQEYKDLRRGIDYSIMKSLKQELQELEATLPEVELEPEVKLMFDKARASERNRWWRAAAILVLVAASSAVLLNQMQPSSSQDLFSQHFEPFENTYISAKRGDDITADPKVQAFMAYDAGDWDKAVLGFETILGQEEDLLVLFYLGSAQLSQGQSQEAIDTFERFLEVSEDNIPEASWYLALSYLKENREEEAAKLLEELKDSDKYGKEAARILKRLK